MKKAIVIMLTGAMILAATACGSGNTSSSAPAAEQKTEEAQPAAETETVESTTVEEKTDEAPIITEEPMTYDEYAAAEIDSEVVIEGAVQAKQAYYAQDDQGTANVYLHRVKGYKAEWSGEIEIIDATWMFVDGEYIADAEDVTALLGTDELIKKQNKKVLFKGVTVEPIGEDGTAAFLYNWDGSGAEGDDLYFNVSVNGQTYNFTVESYLCGPDTDVYKAIKDLHIGDVIDLEGFLYWYEGPNPHITAVLAQ